MNQRQQIDPRLARQIRIGRPLPFSVYDRYGNLLLRAGFIISSELQRNTLLKQGVFRQPPSGHSVPDAEGDSFTHASHFTVFETIEILIARLEQAYALLDTDQRQRFPLVCAGIGLDIQQLCEDNPDAVLAGIQVSQHLPYELTHPLHCGILCELIGKALALPLMQRLGLVCGAISHDVGIIRLQPTLDEQPSSLSDQQWQQIRQHPVAGEQRLRRAGVDDPTWLDAVLHHHERLDGSGYPYGLRAEQLSDAARLMAIADIYTAMIRPRAHRDAHLARDVLRELYQDEGRTLDIRLVRLFIRHIGVFPPGAIVRLANGEIAVVQKRGQDAANAPVCYSILDADGEPLAIPLERDSSAPEFGVKAMLPHHDHPALHRHLNVLWPPLRRICQR